MKEINNYIEEMTFEEVMMVLPDGFRLHFEDEGITETYLLYLSDEDIGYKDTIHNVWRCRQSIDERMSQPELHMYQPVLHGYNPNLDSASRELLRDLIRNGYVREDIFRRITQMKDPKSITNNFEKYFTLC